MWHRDANLVLQYIPVLLYYIVPDPTILHWTYTNLILLYYIEPSLNLVLLYYIEPEFT